MKKEKTIIVITPKGIESTLLYKIWEKQQKISEVLSIDKKLIGKEKFNKQYLGNFDNK